MSLDLAAASRDLHEAYVKVRAIKEEIDKTPLPDSPAGVSNRVDLLLTLDRAMNDIRQADMMLTEV